LRSVRLLIRAIRASSYALVKSMQYVEFASTRDVVLPLNRRPTAVRPSLNFLAVKLTLGFNCASNDAIAASIRCS
jgi:hypothetical protein